MCQQKVNTCRCCNPFAGPPEIGYWLTSAVLTEAGKYGGTRWGRRFEGVTTDPAVACSWLDKHRWNKAELVKVWRAEDLLVMPGPVKESPPRYYSDAKWV